jgi:hypothetical protein
MGVWKQGRKGWGIPFPLIIVFKIVHYTLIAGRVGIGLLVPSKFPHALGHSRLRPYVSPER